jgi:hypothetical protein
MYFPKGELTVTERGRKPNTRALWILPFIVIHLWRWRLPYIKSLTFDFACQSLAHGLSLRQLVHSHATWHAWFLIRSVQGCLSQLTFYTPGYFGLHLFPYLPKSPHIDTLT